MGGAQSKETSYKSITLIQLKVVVIQTREVGKSHILNVFESRANKNFLMDCVRTMGDKLWHEWPQGFYFNQLKRIKLLLTMKVKTVDRMG